MPRCWIGHIIHRGIKPLLQSEECMKVPLAAWGPEFRDHCGNLNAGYGPVLPPARSVHGRA